MLYDSPVICEYLDTEFGGRRLLPAAGARRWKTLTRAALADGILDAAILARNDRLRPAEQQSQDWIAWQLRKMQGGLDALERDAGDFGDDARSRARRASAARSATCRCAFRRRRILRAGRGSPRGTRRSRSVQSFARTAPVL